MGTSQTQSFSFKYNAIITDLAVPAGMFSDGSKSVGWEGDVSKGPKVQQF